MLASNESNNTNEGESKSERETESESVLLWLWVSVGVRVSMSWYADAVDGCGSYSIVIMMLLREINVKV